ncbi:SDR family NAD(P)-dependent oxidoreductase [Streptomyces sp. NPDC087420]|uniref:SDR family NAD(P)-dependent oxidoreductase n=1 Tax=Streptomyces sp. NPDC087420 TaxID=3365785 RepID=UPI0038347449
MSETTARTTSGNTPKTWFITGTSRGFGRHWAEAALERGDRVTATARDLTTLEPLAERHGDRVLTLALDVTDKAAVDAAVSRAAEHFGALDVVVNNAGFMQFGAVEEVGEEQARQQIETNFFGALWVTKAAVPLLRARGGGSIIQVSSVGGVLAFPTLGLYHASKWALEGLTQSLAAEVAGFGIRVTLVEPIAYGTGLLENGVRATADPAYDPARAALYAGADGLVTGDPRDTRDALLELADSAAPPLRVFLGRGGLEILREEYGRRLDGWEKWDDLSRRAQGGV